MENIGKFIIVVGVIGAIVSYLWMGIELINTFGVPMLILWLFPPGALLVVFFFIWGHPRLATAYILFVVSLVSIAIGASLLGPS